LREFPQIKGFFKHKTRF